MELVQGHYESRFNCTIPKENITNNKIINKNKTKFIRTTTSEIGAGKFNELVCKHIYNILGFPVVA